MIPRHERTDRDPMTRATIVELLHAPLPELGARYAVLRLALFGSAARDELRPESDVDILVAFDGLATFDRYVGLRDRLEQLLGRRVDLVTERGLKPRARRAVEKELVRVA